MELGLKPRASRSGPSTPADAEGDIDAVAFSGSSTVPLALGTGRHHYAASASFIYLHFLALAYQRGKGSVAYILGSWCQAAKVSGGEAGAALSLSLGS